MNYEVGAMIGMFGAGFFVFMFAIAIVCIVANWKLFEKADVEGWKSIIPILNTWEMFKIGGVNPLFILLFFIPIVGGFVSFYLIFKFVEGYGFSLGGFLLYLFFTPIMSIYMAFSDNVKYVGEYYSE